MPKPKKGPRLGGSPAHQRLMLRNLATALFEHGRITTTEAKARTLRPYAEKLITKAKKAHLGENPLHNRREVLKSISDKGVVHHLFTEIAPTYAERPGGYTRITKIGPRHGDNAPMAVIELVTEAYNPKPAATTTTTTTTKAKKKAEPKSTKSTEDAPAAEVTKADDVAPAEVEAPNETGETEVLSTEATDVETAEAESTAGESTEADEADEAPEAAAEESENEKA